MINNNRILYGYYSARQVDRLKEHGQLTRTMINEKGETVEASEIVYSPEEKSNWPDAVYLGAVKYKW